eukprot:GHVS01032441.1.p1 GENE.GHVS01032441.1~~GHVS01032441.1.p1  ORF type:complete len:562 (-),score=57.91 GHVS01032441.1:392-2077(-)
MEADGVNREMGTGGECISYTTPPSFSSHADNCSGGGSVDLTQRKLDGKSINPWADYTSGGSPMDVLGSKEKLGYLPNGMKMPTVKEILECIPQHCKERSIVRSILNALRDLVYVGLAVYFMLMLQQHILREAPAVIRWATWALYAFVQGTFFTGIWVVGHECGHGAFSPWPLVNDVVGYILHTPLLVPYFSWKYSHSKHHSYTNHLTYGETHVPSSLAEVGKALRRVSVVGEDAFAAYGIFTHFVVGWPMYVLTNATGCKRDWRGVPIPYYGSCKQIEKIDREMAECKQNNSAMTTSHIATSHSDNRTAEGVRKEVESGYTHVHVKGMNHFVGHSSIIFPEGPIRSLVTLSGCGCALVLLALFCWAQYAGWSTVIRWYLGPYLVTNGYLVLYTWLQHTHPNIPHYGDDAFTWLRGALSTVDRPYPWLIDTLHHGIGSTHVLHHLDSKVPHYHAREASAHLQRFLGPLYRRDPTPIWKCVWALCKVCHYVDDVRGVQYFKSHRDFQAILTEKEQPPTETTPVVCAEHTASPPAMCEMPTKAFSPTEKSLPPRTIKKMIQAGA